MFSESLKSRFAMLVVLVVLMSVGVCAYVVQSGAIRRAAWRAILKGSPAIAFVNLVEQPEGDISAVMGSATAMVMAPADRSPVVTVERDYIVTWRVFRIVREIGPARSAARFTASCQVNPPARLSLTANEIAVPITGGSAVVQGIRITMSATGVADVFEMNKTYLMFVGLCSGRLAILPYGLHAVLEVEPNDKVAAIGGFANDPNYVDRLSAITTLEDVRRIAERVQ